MSDTGILNIVQEEVTEMMRLPAFNPDLVRVYRYRHAIPQYGAGTAQRLEAIEQAQSAFPGLILGGNLHEGIGMADRVAQADRLASAAEQLLETL